MVRVFFMEFFFKKKFRIVFREFFVFRDSTSNVESACNNFFGGSRTSGLAGKGIRLEGASTPRGAPRGAPLGASAPWGASAP
jgi:hypothetical protein